MLGISDAHLDSLPVNFFNIAAIAMAAIIGNTELET